MDQDSTISLQALLDQYPAGALVESQRHYPRRPPRLIISSAIHKQLPNAIELTLDNGSKPWLFLETKHHEYRVIQLPTT